MIDVSKARTWWAVHDGQCLTSLEALALVLEENERLRSQNHAMVEAHDAERERAWHAEDDLRVLHGLLKALAKRHRDEAERLAGGDVLEIEAHLLAAKEIDRLLAA